MITLRDCSLFADRIPDTHARFCDPRARLSIKFVAFGEETNSFGSGFEEGQCILKAE